MWLRDTSVHLSGIHPFLSHSRLGKDTGAQYILVQQFLVGMLRPTEVMKN